MKAHTSQLAELFNHARNLPPGAAREQFLDTSCEGDAPLRQRVCALLDANESAGDFLTPAQLEPAVPEVTELPGEWVGRYKLVEKLGEGGCGVVYLAEQERPVRRRVALKIIKLGMDTKQVVARFEAERQALAMMDHPHIARVFDAGATNTGRPYFVMELVTGRKITSCCDEQKLSLQQRLELFMQVCDAIQHAHQKGIIHRDIKPSNILVTNESGVAMPKVIDFGIAKATEGRLSDLTVFTEVHHFIGTPAYMSPEQAEATSADIDTRTDIFSLGVLLYELLTGRTPFETKTLTASGIDEIRRIIREKEPPRPSTALDTMAQATLTTVAHHRASEPPKLLHAIRGDLDWIAMKTLEKDRARRYDTAKGLAADIQRHLENEPVLARPPSAGYRFQKMVRRNKLTFSAIAAVTTVLVLAVVVSTWQAVRATRAEKHAFDTLAEVAAERDAKELARRNAESSEARALNAERTATANAAAERTARQDAEAISTFLGEVFQSPDPTRNGRTITVAEILDTAAKKLEIELASQPDHRAQLQTTLGASYHALGLYREAIALREKVRDYLLVANGAEHPATLTAMDSLGRSYNRAGLRDEALKLWEEALTLSRKVLGPEHPDTLRAMHHVAISYMEAGRRAEALELQEEVLPLRRNVLGSEHPDTLGAMHNLAAFYSETGRKDEALKLQEEVLPLHRKVLGPEHPKTLRAMHNLATSYFNGGRKDEALKLREEVLPLYRKVLGPDHPDTLLAMSSLAAYYLAVGRTAEGLPLLVEASARNIEDTDGALKVAALQAWFGKDADLAATRQRMLGWARDATKLEDLERVAKLTSLQPVADASHREAALVLARRSVELGQMHQWLPDFNLALGMAEYRSGHYPAADEALVTAAQTASSVPGNASPARIEGTANFHRAMALFRQGKPAEARALFTATEAKMKPLPADYQNPIADTDDSDDLILWLACKEARALLNGSGKPAKP